ncbi:hypothetical protein Vadar_023564 [Vaccinium darrowii]|uniref:Uncharacterized protein n=1 Tax=Vaccinium darrowii TaxID=229202 RepID=A0ACB7YYU6_9ERIC|nr:hypothetical protein Vadar_023564 [Vaccinium darrowii]
MNSSNPPDYQNFSAYSSVQQSESQEYTPPRPSQPQQYHPPPPPSQPQQYHPPPPASSPPYGSQSAIGIPVYTGPSSTSVAWSTGLFDCFEDIPNCIITSCCPCVTFGQIAEIIDKGSTSCVVSGVLYFFITHFSGVPCIYSCGYRSKLRNPIHIAWASMCRLPCPLLLRVLRPVPRVPYRELKNRGFDMSIGWEGNVQKQRRELPMAQGMTR